MSNTNAAYEDEVTFIAAAIREESRWVVRKLGDAGLVGLEALLRELRNTRAEGALVGFVCVNDDWCAVVRPVPGGARLLLSDATAGVDFDLAADMLDDMGVEIPTEDEAEADPWPEGDFDLLEDLGVGEQVLGVVFDDEELYASEMVMRVAEELGCGDQLADVVGLD